MLTISRLIFTVKLQMSTQIARDKENLRSIGAQVSPMMLQGVLTLQGHCSLMLELHPQAILGLSRNPSVSPQTCLATK